MKRFTLFVVAIAALPITYTLALYYDKNWYFPRHAELSSPGYVLSVLDSGFRDETRSDPGYYYSQAMSGIRDDDALFARARQRFQQLGSNLEIQYMYALKREIERRGQMCVDAINRGATGQEEQQACSKLRQATEK